MKDEDLLSIVQELPLYVQLTLYRANRVVTSPTLSLVSPNEGNSTFTPPSTRNVSPDTTAIINNVIKTSTHKLVSYISINWFD